VPSYSRRRLSFRGGPNVAAPSAGRRFKDAIYEQFARVAKALASPHRIELVDLLAQGPRTVEALAQLSDMSLANTSQHLQVLRGAGLVEATKQGLFVTYRLADETVADLFLGLRGVAEARLAEVDRIKREFLAERDQLEAVDERALRRRVRDGDVTVDRRPTQGGARGGAHPGRGLDASARSREGARDPPEEERDRRVLPRPVLRAGRRGGEPAQEEGLPGGAAGRRLLDWTAHGFRLEASGAK
jgi:DNA-binding transcriptional ArsR family regulator